MKKPNLFIVGAPKSGTTSMYYYLNQHPDIFMSTVKEPNYFCREFQKESDKYHGKRTYFHYRTPEDYLKLFEGATDEKILGEATTRYLYSKDAAKGIYEFNSDAKIVIMLREPVSHLYSLHSELLYGRSETISDFKAALEAEGKRKQWKNVPKLAKAPCCLYYSEMAKFKEQIERFKKYFPDKQIMIIIFDDFKKDTLGTYKNVLKFLGVDSSFVPVFERINANKNVKSKWIMNIIMDPDFRLKKIGKILFPLSLRKKIRKALIKSNISQTKRKPMDPELERELKKKYKGEVEGLSKLLNIDLVHLWGYDKV